MMKYFIPVLLCLSLTSCDMISNIRQGLANDAKANAPKTRGVLTRASVDASGLAVVTVAPANNPADARPLVALSFNNNAANFGEEGRVGVTLRGGLVVSQYVMGNDLLNVKTNANDPIQNARPVADWPANVVRQYELPGDGLSGEVVKVSCQYQAIGNAEIEILEHVHKTVVMTENCEGDAAFENRYMVDGNGLVWRSEQWVGQNDVPLLIDIVEPLDE